MAEPEPGGLVERLDAMAEQLDAADRDLQAAGRRYRAATHALTAAMKRDGASTVGQFAARGPDAQALVDEWATALRERDQAEQHSRRLVSRTRRKLLG
jgi:hypothetical protein